MILLLAVAFGFLSGFARAKMKGERYALADLSLGKFLFLGLLPQWLAFNFPVIRGSIPDNWAAAALVGSHLLLLVFVWRNRNAPGFWLLGLGFLLNLAVISLNHGWMPISTDVLARLRPDLSPLNMPVGARFGTSKDRIWLPADIHLIWLSDWLITPTWFPLKAVFSPGDVLIALGACLFLWPGKASPGIATAGLESIPPV